MKKQKDKKNIINSVVGFAGVATAVVAMAGVAVVATMELKDKKNRVKVKKMLVNVKDQAIGYVDTLKSESNDLEKNHTAKKITANTKKVVEKAKSAFSDTELNKKKIEIKKEKH